MTSVTFIDNFMHTVNRT